MVRAISGRNTSGNEPTWEPMHIHTRKAKKLGSNTNFYLDLA